VTVCLLLQFHINSTNPISHALPYPRINCSTLPAAMLPYSLTRLQVCVHGGILSVVIDTTVSVNAYRVGRHYSSTFFTKINAGF